MILPRWKREQKAHQRKKLGSLLKLVTFLLVSVLVGWGVFSLFKIIKSAKLPREGRQTIVLATRPIVVLSLEPQGNLTILSIPENTYVEVPHGFGSHRLGAVWGLGGGQLLAETVQELLGAPIDGWIGPSAENGKWKRRVPTESENGKETTLSLKNNLTSWKIFLRPKELLGVLRNLQTNLTIFDLAKIWLWVKNTRFDKTSFLDLEQTKALSTLVLADGSKALTIDQGLLDKATQELFKDSKLANEHFLIEILNGSEKAGLANRVARLITNLGGTVVSLGNSLSAIGQCQIRGEEKVLPSFTAWRLAQVFNCEIIREKPGDLKTDLQITIGSDYWQKLFQK